MSSINDIFDKVMALEPVPNEAKGKPFIFCAQKYINAQLASDKKAMAGILVNFIYDLEAGFPFLKKNKAFNDMVASVEGFDYKIRRLLPEQQCKDLLERLESYKGVEVIHGKWEKFSSANIVVWFTLAVLAAGKSMNDEFRGRLVFIP